MKLVKPRMTLEDFILEMIKVSSLELELRQLQDWVARLDLRDCGIEKHICFNPENYQRQLLYRDSKFEAILVCWQPGQFSPIHDHGDSLNVTRVYQGRLTSRTFARHDCATEKLSAFLVEEKYLQKDEVIGVDRDRIHQLANTSEQNLVTLNVYVQPIQQMRVYHSTSKQSELLPVGDRVRGEFMKSKTICSKVKSATVAIVGGGFSGSMMAVHLLKNVVSNLNVKLIERRPLVGEGVAYSTNWDCHLLNVPAGKMSAFADVPDQFWRWLQTSESGIAKQVSPNDFVPRKLYGEYVRSNLAEAETKARAGVGLERLTDEAIALEIDGERVNLRLSSGKSLQADRVVLALGNFPPGDPPVADSSFYQSKRYLRFWSASSLLSSLSPEEPILIIGSGLTALDAILALDRQQHQGKIYVVSRRGLFPQPHQPTTTYPSLFESESAPKTILSLVRQIRQEIKSAEARGYNWHSVINSLRPQTQTIWQSLSIAEKQRFLRHVRPYWEIHRHRVPSVISDKIASHHARQIKQKFGSGQLHILTGRIQAYNEDAEGVNVSIRRRCSNYTDSLRVSAVINCTGSECNYRQLQHPLIENLLKCGLVRPDPLNLGLDVADNGALIHATGEISSLLFTLGSPQKGCLWETTAVAEIRQQAQTLAQELLTIQTPSVRSD
jgi:uncharacterized NAD(P)/FAD-binding protein YdhS/predicted metal-dependent enzyme (double-stranded beta helix superfamily)